MEGNYPVQNSPYPITPVYPAPVPPTPSTGSGDALTVGAIVGTALLMLGGIFFFSF